MPDNPAMSPSFRRARRSLVVLLGFASTVLAQGPELGSLRARFPTASIDTVQKADSALAATSGAKAQVEKQYKSDSRGCIGTFLVNACIDKARELQRKRLAEIDGVELEANRFKRKDHADRLESDRARRESERTAKQKSDTEQRARNRENFDDRQGAAQRDDAARTQKEASRAGTGKVRKPVTKPVTPAAASHDGAQRTKNAAEYSTKVNDAKAHQAEIAKRLAAKTADRKRRAEEKAAKEAKAAAPQPAARP